jgi:hypothetical protein
MYFGKGGLRWSAQGAHLLRASLKLYRLLPKSCARVMKR